jgi:two-component system, NtrC family, response regulator AtoC
MRVLIADDERNIRDSLASYLRKEGIDCAAAADGAAARALLEAESFDAMVLDLRMPRMGGLDLLSWSAESGPRVPAIVISAYGEVRDAVRAMKLGARDYLVKPFDPEELLLRLRRVAEESVLEGRLEAGRKAAAKDGWESWLGGGERMRAVRSLVEKVAPTSSTVLITGESGTGKEVVARLIHALSANPEGPFVAVNVGGIPEQLLESELFGYDKGAFTGADSRKLGMFEVASSGTIFLDEIGDMPQHLQVKLLRVLQEKKVRRLGGTQPIPVRSRVVAATNRDLEALLAEGSFREDLYYRLNVIRIELPPLRERREDIPRLAGIFVERCSREMGRRIRGVDPEALARLGAYSYPGNVRELENVIERACILCESDEIRPRDLGESFASAEPSPKRGILKDAERDLIERTISKHGGNMTRAAAELGISRRTLFNKRKEMNSGRGLRP